MNHFQCPDQTKMASVCKIRISHLTRFSQIAVVCPACERKLSLKTLTDKDKGSTYKSGVYLGKENNLDKSGKTKDDVLVPQYQLENMHPVIGLPGLAFKSHRKYQFFQNGIFNILQN